MKETGVSKRGEMNEADHKGIKITGASGTVNLK
jgi:hypothetical protein